jgi:hypothetical protein
VIGIADRGAEKKTQQHGMAKGVREQIGNCMEVNPRPQQLVWSLLPNEKGGFCGRRVKNCSVSRFLESG